MRSVVYADMNGCGRPPHKSSFTVLELPTSYHPEDMVRGVPKANRNDLEFKLIYVRQLYRAGMDTRTGSKARARRKPHNPKKSSLFQLYHSSNRAYLFIVSTEISHIAALRMIMLQMFVTLTKFIKLSRRLLYNFGNLTGA